MSALNPRSRRSGPNWLAIATGMAAILFVILAVVLAVQMATPDAISTGPKLQIDHEKIDFGRVVYDKSVRAVFTLSNAGDRPLQIADRQISTRVVEGC